MVNLISENIGDPLKGIGPLGLEGLAGSDAAGKFEQLISTILGIMTVVAFIWFLFILVIGAIGIMSAGGDKNALETAKKRLTNAIVGFVVFIAAIFILALIAYLLGLDTDQLFRPSNFINNLWN